MALTMTQQVTALAVLDVTIPAVQTVGSNGRYTQVVRVSPDGTHTCGLDEYLGSFGIGYIRFVERVDDTGVRWRYSDPHGPEDRPSGWQDVTPRAMP